MTDIRHFTHEDKALFPIGNFLNELRRHCRDRHNATPDDWRQNVNKWHSEQHPSCSMPTWKECRIT